MKGSPGWTDITRSSGSASARPRATRRLVWGHSSLSITTMPRFLVLLSFTALIIMSELDFLSPTTYILPEGSATTRVV